MTAAPAAIRYIGDSAEHFLNPKQPAAAS